MSFGFDSEEFDLELEQAGSNTSFGGGGNRKWQKNMVVAGPEVKFAKAGRFEVKVTNKQGKEVKKYPSELQVILLNSAFGRQQWVEEGGRNKVACSTISHTVKDREGNLKEVEGGWWQIPYGPDLTNKNYNPIGQRVKADGTAMSCAEAMAAGLCEGCGQKGGLYAYVVGMTNEDEEMVQVQTPFVVTISTPMASGVAFQIYALRKLKEAGYRPGQVITKLSIAKTPNGKANQLVFEMDDRVEDELYQKAIAVYKQAEAEWEEMEAKKAAERKAKYAKNKPGPAAATEFVATDDDFSF